MQEEIRQRLECLRNEMKKEGIDYYMIPTSDFHHSEYVDGYFKTREYFSGFTGSNGTLAVGMDMAGLWTDGRYFIQAERELEGTGIELFRMMEEGVPDLPDFLQEHMKDGEILGFDGRTVNCREGRELEKKLCGKWKAEDGNKAGSGNEAEDGNEAGSGTGTEGKKKTGIRHSRDLADRIWKNRPPLPCHKITILPEEISGRSTAEKLKDVRAKISEAGAEYFFLSKLDDLMWLLNIRGGDVECNPVALSYGFITPGELYFFIQPEEVTEAFEAYAEENHIVIMDYKDISGFLETFDYQGSVLLDENNVSYALYRVIAGHTVCVTGDNPTERMKAVKNETELSRMEEVYIRDSAAVIKFIYWLKTRIGTEEITEISAAEYLDDLRRHTEGFLDLSFPTISAYKENAAMMHYEATSEHHKTLRQEGLLLVDSGGQYMGGTTDVTRTIVLGEISGEMKMHFTKTAVGMLQLTDAKFLYGCTGRNLDILARQPLWDIGIDYKCGTGHGIGYMLNVHEGPQNIRWRFASGMKEAVLEAGMIVSNEPGVYKEGSHGIRTENILAVRKGEKNGDGQFLYFDTLTYVPIDREAIDKKYMQPADLERLNRYHAAVYEKTEKYLTAEEKQWLAQATAPIL